MSIKKIIISLCLVIFSLPAFCHNKLFQVSTIGALTLGVFDGDTHYKEIEKHGDFGLGTFEGLNGEMVALNGHYYRMDPKGNLSQVRNTSIAPFAEVTDFKPSQSFQISNINSYPQLTQSVITRLKNKNLPYAIKITGEFDNIFMRSLLHYKKPYPSLVTASKEQIEFTLHHSEGTLVGFWFPKYWGVIAVNGLHLHFVNKALTKGGHVLNMKIEHATLEIMPIQNVEIKLPNTKTFANTDFNQDIHKRIEAAEGATQ